MRYITDAQAARLLDAPRAREIVLAALADLADGRAAASKPPGLFIRTPDVPCTYHAKGAYLSGRRVAGFRLAGFPQGESPGGRLQMLLLTDLASSVPHALVASESLHPLRVGMAIAVAVETLRAADARTLALLGAGRLARGTIEAIQAVTPFATVRIAARSLASAQRFADSVQVRDRDRLVPVADAAAACEGADVIVTLTSVDEPLVRAAWCKPGSLLVSAGGRQECEEEALLQAARRFVDDWAQCSVLGDVAVLARNGRIKEEDTESLAAVCAGRIPGRANDAERLVAVPQGLAILDIAFGQAVYEAAVAQGIGIDLPR